ncbi:MAG TPA: DUF3817 domain-containing protein [Acidimicrobiales bacterium]|nr:DUF3817 domain-containing protein [Acidimicrobiales bacterium]
MSEPKKIRSMDGALTRYRIMAYTVGTGLLILVFVGIPIQIWGHSKTVVAIVGPIHGYFYLVYLVAALDLARRAHFGIGRLLIMISAGLVPFVAFIIEHKIVKSIRDEQRGAAVPFESL